MNFTVYRSSAGSGKTYTLVREYLLIALGDSSADPRRFREILAVTFTNKAASEMKVRVLRYLEELTHLQDVKADPLADSLMKELKIDRLTLRSRAQSVLKAILHNYSDFAIGTIDAFVQRIVRAFSNDLDLPVNFEIETDEKRLIREAVDVLISRLGNEQEKELTDLLLRFAETNADEEKTWQPEDEIRKISEHLVKEDQAKAVEKIKDLKPADFISIRNRFAAYINQFENGVRSEATLLLNKLQESGISVYDLAGGKTGIASKIVAFSSDNFEKIGEFEKTLNKFRDSKNPFAGNKSKDIQQRITALLPEINSSFDKIFALIEKGMEFYILRQSILKHLFAISVLTEVEKIIDEFREQDHIVHISVFNKLIAKIVQSEPAPFIFERLGERFRHFLIDEFQDTSSMQWQNFLPLIDNALAGGNFSMLVGDGKQAIYRWRGGDVRQFAALPHLADEPENTLVAERVQSLVRNFKEEKLGMNFRSKAEIVEFNNGLFDFAAKKLHEKYSVIYKEAAQEIRTGNQGGYVQIQQLGEVSTAENEMIRLVHEAMDAGWKAADIAVIARSNENVNALATALLEAGIPVLATESLFLRNSPEVNFLLSVLKAIDSPDDVLAATSAIHYLSASRLITQDIHHALLSFRNSGSTLIEWLNEQGFDIAGRNIPSKNFYHRTEELIRLFGMNSSPGAFVLFFLDEVLAFSSLKNTRLNFFDWWEDRSKKASVIVPDGMDAVRVMTIHKSKGLEFPVVIVPFAGWHVKTSLPAQWVDYQDELAPELKSVLVTPSTALDVTRLAYVREEELAKRRLDMVNELYVALTRAADELHILLPAAKNSSVPDDHTDKLILSYLTSIGAVFNDDRITFGKRKVVSHPATASKSIELKIIPGVHWEERLMLKSASSEAWSDAEVNARVKGKLLHLLLSKITSSDQIDEVITSAVDEGTLQEEERELYSEKLKRIITDPVIADCFASGSVIHREKEVLLKSGKTIRPDLVIEQRDSVIILDYKTGNPESKHRSQVDLYAGTLHEMGYRKIIKRIYYTESATIDSW